MNLALFDFDGTLSDRDSFLLFIKKTVGAVRFYSVMAGMSPQICRFLCRRYPNHRLKEDVLTRFFQNWSPDDFSEAAEQFCRDTVPGILRDEGARRLRRHQERGDNVVIVSATPELVLAPWCRTNGLDLLATRMQIVDNRLTGRIEGKNCRGREKVARITGRYRIDDYLEIYAYGDTEGDRPMLAMATKSYYRPFR